MNNKTQKCWPDKTQQDRKYCGPSCKGPYEKLDEDKSVKEPCKCELDRNKCSCIKPWLDKAAERMKVRRASSVGSSRSKSPLPDAWHSLSPTMLPCPPCLTTDLNTTISQVPLQVQAAFVATCNTQCGRIESASTKKTCSDKPDCKKKNKKPCNVAKKTNPKKGKRTGPPVAAICGPPRLPTPPARLPSPCPANPCGVCGPRPCVTCPRPETKPPPKPSQHKPPPIPAKPSEPKPQVVVKPSLPKNEHDEHEEPDVQEEPVPDVFNNKVDCNKHKPMQVLTLVCIMLALFKE